MRVALVDPSLFTLPYDAALARGLAHGGHDVTLHGRRPRPGEGDASGVDLDGAFYRLSESRAVSRLPGALRLAVKGVDHAAGMLSLLARLRRHAPDVIHFQWLPLPVIDRRLLAGFARVAPLVLTVHDTNPFNGNPTARLQKLGTAASLAGFDRLIVHTRQGQARLAAQGIARQRIAVLPHGPLAAPQAGAAADPMEGPLSLTLFGKIKPYKGADVLIRAYAALPDALKAQARVRIVGQSYMDAGELAVLAASLGVAARVAIEDRFVADADMAGIFADNTIAVFPYREIEASGVLSLAAAFGRPIVASRLGNFAETLADGEQGLLVPPGDVEALSQALARMIADRPFAAACAQRVRALAADAPGWDDIARTTARLYADARRPAAGFSGAAAAATGGHA